MSFGYDSSTVKASFEDESSEKFWGMMEKTYRKIPEKPLTLPCVPRYLSL